MVHGVSTRRKSASRLLDGVFVPGTVFTGDSDLCKMLLAMFLEFAQRALAAGGLVLECRESRVSDGWE